MVKKKDPEKRNIFLRKTGKVSIDMPFPRKFYLLKCEQYKISSFGRGLEI